MSRRGGSGHYMKRSRGRKEHNASLRKRKTSLKHISVATYRANITTVMEGFIDDAPCATRPKISKVAAGIAIRAQEALEGYTVDDDGFLSDYPEITIDSRLSILADAAGQIGETIECETYDVDNAIATIASLLKNSYISSSDIDSQSYEVMIQSRAMFYATMTGLRHSKVVKEWQDGRGKHPWEI